MKKEIKFHKCKELYQADTDGQHVTIEFVEDENRYQLYIDDGGHVNGVPIDYCPYCGCVLIEKYVKPSVEAQMIDLHEIPLGEPKPCVLGTVKPDEIDYRGGLVSMGGVMGGLEPTLQPYYIRIVRTDEDIEKVMKDLEGKIHGGLGVDISHLEGVTPQEIMDKFNAKYQEQVAKFVRRGTPMEVKLPPQSIIGEEFVEAQKRIYGINDSGMMPNPAWEGHMQPQRPACDLSSVNINVEVSPDNVKKIAESIAENINKSVKRGMSR
jgi:hypothetical protein